MPSLFREATDEALVAHAATFDLLADEATWADSEGEAADVATDMRTSAKLCAQNDRHEAAARLLALAVRRCPMAAEDAAVVEKWCKNQRHKPTVPQRAALEAAYLLLKSGDNRRRPWPRTLLALAKAGGHQVVANRLAVACRQPSSVVKASPFDEDATPKAVKGSALAAAAEAGDAEGVAAALERDAAADDAMEHGVTPLMLAARAGSVSAVKALLAKGADPSRRSRGGCLALGLAAEAGVTECVAALLEGGAEADAADKSGATPLYAAAGRGNEGAVAALLAMGADVDRADDVGNTPLRMAAQNGYEATMAALLAKGAQVDLVNKNGWTPLLIASMNGHQAAVAVLLASGAQTNLAAHDGATPLSTAKAKGHAKVVALLEAHK